MVIKVLTLRNKLQIQEKKQRKGRQDKGRRSSKELEGRIDRM